MNETAVNQAYDAISNGDYQRADAVLQRCLGDSDSFKIRYGLAFCKFNEFMQTSDQTALDQAIEHAEQANTRYDLHFDIHFILAQAYASKYLQTMEASHRQRELAECDISRELVSKRPGMPAERLEKRLDELETEIKQGCPLWN